MVQSFAMAALAFTGHPPLLAIYAVAMAGGVATAFDNPARRSFVVEMVPATHVQNAVSLNSALMTSARDRRPADRGPADRDRRATGGASRSTASPTSPCWSRYWRMNTDEIVRSESGAAGEGPDPRGAALRAVGDRPVRAARDDGDHRHVRDQLPGRLPALRQGEPGRHRHDVHDPVLGGGARLSGRSAGRGAADQHRPIATSYAGRCCSA